MDNPAGTDISPFLEEDVYRDGGRGRYRFGRSRLVRGRKTQRPYLLRPGLLEAVAERIYFQWATARGIATRPIQFVNAGEGHGRTIRHMSALWWTDGEIEAESTDCSQGDPACQTPMVTPEPMTKNAADIPRATALDILLDNNTCFAGWMFDGGQVFRLFNHQALGMAAGPVALLTRYRLLKQGTLVPRLNLDDFTENMNLADKKVFISEALALASLSDEQISRLSTLPEQVCIEVYKLCMGCVDSRGAQSREAVKMLFREGPPFLETFASLYIGARRLELEHQLGKIKLA